MSVNGGSGSGVSVNRDRGSGRTASMAANDGGGCGVRMATMAVNDGGGCGGLSE